MYIKIYYADLFSIFFLNYMQGDAFQLSFSLANLTDSMPFRCGSTIVATIQSCSWFHSRTFLALPSLLLVEGGSVEVFALAEFSGLKWCWAVTEGGWERGLEGKERSRRRDGRRRACCFIAIILTALASGSMQSRLKGFATGTRGGGKVCVSVP